MWTAPVGKRFFDVSNGLVGCSRSLVVERRHCFVDKGAGAVANRGIEDEDEGASRHEGQISER